MSLSEVVGMTIVCVCYLEEVMVCFGSAKDLQIQIEVRCMLLVCFVSLLYIIRRRLKFSLTSALLVCIANMG